MANFIKPCEGRVTSPFGYRMHPIRKERSWHQGVDIAEKGVVLIRAAADGVVTRNGVLGTYGNVVMIVHKINGKTYETNYAHLKNGSKMIVGQRVKQGDIIAYMGNTGSSTAQHLHFEIHYGRWATGQPNAVDPLHYLSFPEFRELQEKLNRIGYKLTVDGINGPNTKSAIKDFQKKQKILVDGNAGPVTLSAIAKEIVELNKPFPKPIVTPAPKPSTEPKGVEIMHRPSTITLKQSAPKAFKKAHEIGILTSDEWAKKAERGELSESDVNALTLEILLRTELD